MAGDQRKTTIRVPASTSNLGSGFDVLGLALSMYLDVSIEVREGPIEVFCSGEGAAALPTDETNLIAQMVLKTGGSRAASGFVLRAVNDIPLTRGFGSSAAAIVAGLALGCWVRDGEIDRDEVLRISTEIEGHPDNVSASIFGGLTVSAVLGDYVHTSSHRLPEGIQIVGIIPDRELSTRAAREALPEHYSRAEVVFNLQRLGVLMSGLASGDLRALSYGVEDKIHQEYRIGLLPEMGDVIAGLNADSSCAGAFVSGAGPAVAGFASADAERLAELGAGEFRARGIEARSRVLAPDYEGARLVE